MQLFLPPAKRSQTMCVLVFATEGFQHGSQRRQGLPWFPCLVIIPFKVAIMSFGWVALSIERSIGQAQRSRFAPVAFGVPGLSNSTMPSATRDAMSGFAVRLEQNWMLVWCTVDSRNCARNACSAYYTTYPAPSSQRTHLASEAPSFAL